LSFFKKILKGKKDTPSESAGKQETFEAEGAEPGFQETETSLARTLRVFEQYNANKTAFLYEQLSPRKKTVFDLVPLLIHIDGQGLLPAGDACQISPHGVYGYEMSPDTARSFTEAFPRQRLPQLPTRASYDPNMPIKSISLIGSLGSIAQNSKSDFDYWICLDMRAFSPETFLYFKEKLRAIDKWAADFAGAEVHCFPLDVAKVLEDDFGSVGAESSGSAQGKLLKEEFYRSMTLVAGQTPMWWVMPPGVDDEEYARLARFILNSNRINAAGLVDLGHVHDISLGEFYGAAIWQINKTIGSPFKSVLKMGLLEEYMLNRGRQGLLSTELKRRLLSNENEVQFLDPYVLMFDRVAAYLAGKDRREDLDLLRQSLYMKAGVQISLGDYRRTDLPRNKLILVNLIRQWGWNHKTVQRLNDYHNWSFRESQQFSEKINRFILSTYKSVSEELNKQQIQSELKISPRDLTILGRKLFIFYSRRTNKIESIKRVIEDPPALKGMTLHPHIDPKGCKTWSAFRGLMSRESIDGGAGTLSLLTSSPFLPEVLLWLINNHLWDTATTVNLNAATGKLATHCTTPDIQALLKEMDAFFPSYKLSELNEEEMLQKPRIVRMFLVINLDEPDGRRHMAETDLCYQNNWGEVFFKGYNDSEEGLKIARNFLSKRFAFDPLEALANFKVFLPNRLFKRELAPRLNKYFGLKVVS